VHVRALVHVLRDACGGRRAQTLKSDDVRVLDPRHAIKCHAHVSRWSPIGLGVPTRADEGTCGAGWVANGWHAKINGLGSFRYGNVH
jgi:hypothetical protein